MERISLFGMVLHFGPRDFVNGEYDKERGMGISEWGAGQREEWLKIMQ